MPSIDSLARHVRLAFRSLGRDRGFTATALLTFALCLGANVALFALVNATLLRPLPFPEADRLVIVNNAYPKAGVERSGSSVPHFLERRAGVAAFAEMAAYRSQGETLTDGNSPDRVDSLAVTPGFFRVLGAQAALGRTFTEEEGVYGTHNVVVLTDGFWRTKFNADPAVLGRTVRFGGGWNCTVIGVLPPDFRFLAEHPQVVTPLCFDDNDRKPEQRHSNDVTTLARLRPDATIATAQAQVDALNQKGFEQDLYAKLVLDAGFRTHVAGLHADFVRETRPILLLLQAGVVLLLLIGGVNLTNLLLVRASARTKELSVRQVLGAGRGEIAGQLVAETLVLTLLGGLLGLALGWAALRGLVLLGAGELPLAGELALDGRVVLVALGASVLAGLALALPVVWQSFHGNLATALAVESRGGTTGRAAHRLRHGLIAAQFALAFVLLAGAGLLGLSFTRVLAVKPGFTTNNVLSGSIALPWSNYKEKAQRVAFQTRLLAELRAIPGVASAGFTTDVPFSGDGNQNGIQIEGRTPAPGESLQAHFTTGVNGDYLQALGIAVREGRLLTEDDIARGEKVCVVDEDVARRYWPERSALGQRLFNGVPKPDEKPFAIVGVVGRVQQNDLTDQRGLGAIYFPYSDYSSTRFFAVLRTSLSTEAAGAALRAAVQRVDPELPVVDLQTMGGRIDHSLQSRRAPMLLAVIFAAVALVLAAVGLYGVLAYAVAQRRREIGVRLALGARPAQIRTQFLGLGARLAAVGAVVGGTGAWFAGRAMQSLLFGVGPVHPLVFSLTAVLLGGVALAACLWPAARAARVHPMEALRSD